MSIASALGISALGAAAIGGGAGLAGGLVKDKLAADNESKQRKIAAEQMKWSPWTGMQPEKVQSAGVGSGALQGLGAGLSMAQQGAQANADTDFRSKLLGIMGKDGAQQPSASPWAPIAMGGDVSSYLGKGTKFFG